MGLWITQILLNFVFGALGFAVLWGRRDQKRLETELERLRRRLEELETRKSPPTTGVGVGGGVPGPRPASFEPASLMTTSGLSHPSTGPTLQEKSAHSDPQRNNLDAYDAAHKLLSRGLDVREVSRRTGLSVAELHLIGKVSQKNQ